MPPDSLGNSLILQEDNDPKNTANSIKEFNRGKKWKDLLAKSISRFKSYQTCITPAEEETKGRNSAKNKHMAAL